MTHSAKSTRSSPTRAVTTSSRCCESALQDADLHVAYWDDDRASWVTEDGHIVTADPDARLVMHGGRTVAAVTTQGDDEETVKAVLKEAAPELESASLAAAIAVQLEEVRASRADRESSARRTPTHRARPP